MSIEVSDLKHWSQENPTDQLIKILKKQIDFCDIKIDEIIRLKDSRKLLLKFYENRQKEVI